jgi:transposase
MLEANSQLTLEQLVAKIHDQFGVETSVTALHRALKQLSITWKNVLPIPIDWNTPHILAARVDYVINMYGM